MPRIGYTSVFALAGGFLAVTASAFAFGLEDEDYVYLQRQQHVERYQAPILNLSPRERSDLHNMINGPRAAADPAARDQNVKDLLTVFLGHQVWEREHPGQLWDQPK